MPERVCIITGASRGIGKATALRFARAGYQVVAIARNEANLAAVAREISAAGGQCLPLAADVAVPAALRQALATAIKHCGRVDVLVNNAGTGTLGPLETLAQADFDAMLALNIGAVFHATQAIWPLMKQQGGGVIVNISSVAGHDPFNGFAVYGGTKAWVNTFSRACADEGKPHGIRVYSLAPGAVETELLRGVLPDLDGKYVLDPDAVAGVVEVLCDPRMAHSTGQTIIVRK